MTNDLQARTQPSLGPEAQPLEPLLNAGETVFVLAGPVTASGSEWYEIHWWPKDYAWPATGWVPGAGKGGVPWLLPKRDVCPESPPPEELWELAYLDWGVGLACYGSRQFTFEATLGSYETCGILGGWTVEPAWLGEPCFSTPYQWIADRMAYANRMTYDGGGYADGTMEAAFAPGANPGRLRGGVDSGHWLAVTITGQFDHPAAQTCRAVHRAGWDEADSPPLTPAAAILGCRAQFAITSITEDGAP